ncbi:MAG: hypothetical protein FJ128_07315, partial [Deltaproteobacteria bacterium]|nr:hypothetical protein [Deltaproteobacteria bacterium]
SPKDGRLTSLIMPWLDAETMSIFPAHAGQTYTGDFCSMLLYGAGWHRAKELRAPATIKLIPLPPYSPELNPVEHIWEYLRENSFKNFSLNSLDEVVDILADGLSFLSQPPEIVRSMTNFDWLNTLCLTCN